jgi:putative ABC transport system permease protein
MRRTFFNFLLALEGVNGNKLRAVLTGLGIMFGVGAVIAMLAIGTGARESILQQLKLIGTNNIVIKSVTSSGEDELDDNQASDNGEEKRTWTPGLTLEDAVSISRLIPSCEKVSPEVVLPASVMYAGKLLRSRCVGTENSFFTLNNLDIDQDKYFHKEQLEKGLPVCIIGKNVQTKLFGTNDPVGKQVKLGNNWLTVIGVLKKRQASKENLKNLGIRDYNNDVFIPVKTALLRYKNRARIDKSRISSGRGDEDENQTSENYHQLDRIVVEVTDTKFLSSTADLIARMLKRRHRDVVDFEIEVPELLVEQQQKTQDTFNFVLAVIAGISLLVGGIGIMNIMLASVLERIKEIGVRRSLGAKRTDIVWQFLFEAVFISLLGGIIGVLIGVLAARTIASYAEIPTIVSSWSILLSFGVAATVGLVFGIFPAQKAARQDPIKALRSD